MISQEYTLGTIRFQFQKLFKTTTTRIWFPYWIEFENLDDIQ